MTRINKNKIDFEETGEPSTPFDGEVTVYVKNDKEIYKKSDDGEEVRLSIRDYQDLDNRVHGNEDHSEDFLVEEDVSDFRRFSSYQPGMVNWSDELDYTEVQRVELSEGRRIVVDRVEFRQQGGGDSTNDARLRVRDVSEDVVVHEEDLNSASSDVGESSSGSVVVFEVYNFSGDVIDASPTIDYRIVE